ncbi:unnamed protein product [Schistosoma mattheei]|uniref:Uncharacterized protein n=1 Tax=Schistosoma mattheei TaxID=31246 RepID=A0A183Q0S8_9TREM|nr:unnamed protein product [Schistosoma mattheei]
MDSPPTTTFVTLSNSTETNLSSVNIISDGLADMADKIMEAYHDNHCVNSLQPVEPTDTSRLASFQKQLT